MATDLNSFFHAWSDKYNDFLSDESRTTGKAESISFPENEAEIQGIVKHQLQKKIPITVQGSRTGITGAAVPNGGHILNLSKMTKVTGLNIDETGQFLIRVQPGISLSELNQQLESCQFEGQLSGENSLKALDGLRKSRQQFWPPDPSEKSASIGGMAANNSRGICAYHYGAVSQHIKSIRLIDTQGDIQVVDEHSDIFSRHLNPQSNNSVNDMGLIFGSEGMLGTITELTLSLQALPSELWGIVFFFEDEAQAVNYIQAISHQGKTESDNTIVAIELMDQTTLESIRSFKKGNSRLQELPNIDSRFITAVYLEIHGNDSPVIEELCEWLMEKVADYDSDPDNSWAFSGENEIERLRLFRNAAPEAINYLIDQARHSDARITKLGTDMRFQGKDALKDQMHMYRRDLEADGLKAAIFGHAADGHLHVNILPRDYLQFKKGRKRIEDWAKKISAKGGSVATEHGIGKIKKEFFRSIPLPVKSEIIRRIKPQLDPDRLWNPGNMFDD